jgi:uncharacterized small protein (DUF1192 family)
VEPRKAKPVPKDLNPMSVADLDAYILGLQEEIERARAMIAAKKAVRSGAEAFFKR